MFALRRLLLQTGKYLRRSVPSNRYYSKSTGQSNVNQSKLPMGTGTQASSSSSSSTVTRSRARFAVPAVFLGFAGFVSFLHYNDERRAVPKGMQSSNSGCGCGSNTTVKGPIIGGPFTLMSTQNSIVTDKDLAGKWVLLYFGYSFSPDVGPEQLKMISKSVDKLETEHNQKILPIFVTLDPQRDSVSHLHEYLKEFDSRILGLTGASTAMRQMAQEYRVFFKKVQEDGDDYLVDTSHNIYLLNPKKQVVRCFGTEYNPDDLSSEVLKEVTSVPQ